MYECNCDSCKAKPKQPLQLATGKPFKQLLNAVEKAFKKLHENGSYKPEDLGTVKEYKALVTHTTNILSGAIIDNDIPPAMLKSLKNDVYLFSGLRTHAELFEASRQLLTEDGQVKSFSKFSQDIAKLKENYNQTYLEAEYQFAVTSAQMAGNWADLSPDYYLQYRTAFDERVRDTHRVLHDITLPIDDAFWLSYYPPNGWGCRCDAVEVLKDSYDLSDSADAITKGEMATSQIDKNGNNRLEIFRFNPGAQGVVFPPDHPYNKVAGAEKVKAVLADTSHLDDKVSRFTGISLDAVKEREYYKAAVELAPNIRPAEALGINTYTGSDYRRINEYLRSGRKPPKTMMDALIDVTNSGMDKLPKYKGTVYRGTRLYTEQLEKYEKAFKSGEPVNEEFFFSTTTDFTKKFDGNVVYMIQSKNGVPVKALSQHATEEEILFKPDTQFKVKSFIKANGKYEIVMEEV